MTPNTHIKIARISLEQLKCKGIYLKSNAFISGNVAPDFSPYHKIIRHYKENSLGYVEKTVLEISKIDNITEKSFLLGIVSHYLADYFCYPHFNNMKFNSKEVLEHVLYEKELDKYSKGYSKDNVKDYKFEDFYSLFEAITSDYKNTRKFKNDMDTALNMIINLVGNINCWNTAKTLIY